MIKNLSKKRFIIFLSVALFLVLVIFIQYVVLSVLKKGKEEDYESASKSNSASYKRKCQ